MIVDSGVLDIVRDIMGQTKTQSILKECCWLLSNVIAGTQVQIDAVIKAKLIPPIINALENVCLFKELSFDTECFNTRYFEL